MARPPAAEDGSLKRLGGGRWQTRDERFTIEPQSGTWVVVDGEQTDDLGLPLVRGPFRSLGDAKEAIGDARSAPPASSPLADRIGRGRATAGSRAEPASPAPPTQPTTRRASQPAEPTEPTTSAKPGKPTTPPEQKPAEPRWLAALEPDALRHARRTIARLAAAGAPDPEGMARRDIVGDVAAVAAYAIGRRLDGLEPDAEPGAIAALLADGRDEDLGVRWRLVDGDGRPIAVDPARTRPGRRPGR